MTTSNEHQEPSTQADRVGTSMLPAEAQATVAEIKADNAAMRVNDEIAEVKAEATEEQAKLLNEVTEQVVEELQERQEAAEQA
jgi:hypothetical protein